MSNVGYATLQIIPSASGFLSKLQAELGADFTTAGKRAGKDMGEGVKGGLYKAMQGAGMAAAGTALAAATFAFVASSLAAFGDFERSLNLVAAAAGATQKEMEELNKLALDLGASTKFSAGEAAAAMLELAKGGLTPAQIQAGALKSALDLAAASGMDLAEASNTIVGTMGAFHMSAAQTAEAANALAGAANASTADVAELTYGLAQVGSAAYQSGLSLQDTTGVLAAFANQGIKGSDAGTSLKTMLQRLTPATDKAKDAMKALGVNFVNADGSFKTITEVAQILHDKLLPLSEATRAAALETLFGSDAQRAAAVLMEEGAAGIQKFIDASKNQTAAQAMADASMAGWAGTVEKMTGAWETFKIQFGQFAAPIVTPILEGVAKALEWVTDNSKIAMPVIAALSAAFIALGVALTIMGAAAMFAAVGINLAAAPLWIIIGIIAALVAIIVVVWMWHKEIGAFFVMVWEAIKHGVSVAVEAIGTALTAVGRFFTETIPNAIGTVLAWFASLPGKIWEFIKLIPGLMLDGLKMTVYAIGFGLGLIVGLLINLPGWIWDLLTTMWTKAGELTVAGVTFLVGWITKLVTDSIAFLTALPGKVWALLTSMWNTAKQIVADGVAATLTFFRELPGKVVAFLSELPGKVKAIATDAINWLKQAGIDVVQGLINGITSMVGKLADLIGDLADKVAEGFKDALKIFSPSRVFKGFGQNIVQGLVNGISGQTGSAIKAVRTLAAGVADVPFGFSGATGPAAANAGGGGSRTLNYYAAPGNGLDSEEDLFAAASRTRMVF